MPHLLYFVTATPLIYMAPDIPVRHNTKQSKVSKPKKCNYKDHKILQSRETSQKNVHFFFFYCSLVFSLKFNLSLLPVYNVLQL